MTIETICNQALDVIGYSRHIGNIYEGTNAARALLNAWVETRDALLENMEPDWAKRDAELVLLKAAPNIVNDTANYSAGWNDTFPPLPWLYEYAYPEDCLVPLQIKKPTLFVPMWRPRFNPMRMTYETAGRSILTNIVDPVLIYIAVVGNPDHWEKDFTELMIAALAKKLEPLLMPRQAQQRRQQQQEPRDADAAG